MLQRENFNRARSLARVFCFYERLQFVVLECSTLSTTLAESVVIGFPSFMHPTYRSSTMKYSERLEKSLLNFVLLLQKWMDGRGHDIEYIAIYSYFWGLSLMLTKAAPVLLYARRSPCPRSSCSSILSTIWRPPLLVLQLPAVNECSRMCPMLSSHIRDATL